jgi:hypothetical protein
MQSAPGPKRLFSNFSVSLEARLFLCHLDRSSTRISYLAQPATTMCAAFLATDLHRYSRGSAVETSLGGYSLVSQRCKWIDIHCAACGKKCGESAQEHNHGDDNGVIFRVSRFYTIQKVCDQRPFRQREHES